MLYGSLGCWLVGFGICVFVVVVFVVGGYGFGDGFGCYLVGYWCGCYW